MRRFLWIAVVCLAVTLALSATANYQSIEHQCAESSDLDGNNTRFLAAIYFGAWCVAFFSRAVSEYGKRQLESFASSDLGLFPLIAYPIKIYFIQVAVLICCIFTLANPLAAFFVTSAILEKCGLL